MTEPQGPCGSLAVHDAVPGSPSSIITSTITMHLLTAVVRHQNKFPSLIRCCCPCASAPSGVHGLLVFACVT